jgi:hypothetical protein
MDEEIDEGLFYDELVPEIQNDEEDMVETYYDEIISETDKKIVFDIHGDKIKTEFKKTELIEVNRKLRTFKISFDLAIKKELI